MGGKYKLLPQILPLFPDKISTFIDLFAGGCNVGINVSADKIICNDIIYYLIDLYDSLKTNDPENIIGYIDRRISDLGLSSANRDAFVKLRQEYNTTRHPLDFFILIAHSFNYQIRFNSRHEYNTPFGKDKSSFNNMMRTNLSRFIERIQSLDICFTSCDFIDFDLTGLTTEDFVYCDPPYLITNGAYNDGKRGFNGWDQSHEYRLLELLSDLDNLNIRFALSNVITHKGKKNQILIDWIEHNNFHVEHLKKNYAASSYHTADRSKNGSDEVLITNYL